MSNKVSAITGVFDDTTGALKSISRDCGGASTGTPTPIAAISTAQQAAIDAGGSAVVVNSSGVLVDKNLSPVSGGSGAAFSQRFRRKALNLAAAAASRQVIVGIFGDSNVAGAGTGSGGSYNYNGAALTGFVPKLVQALAALGIRATDTSFVGSQFVNGQAAFQTYDPRWVFSGGVSIWGAYEGIGGDTITVTGAGAATFTPGIQFDSVELAYVSAPNNQTCTITADGGATVYATAVGNQPISNRTTGTVFLGGLRSSVTLNFAAGGSGFPVIMVRCWDSTKPGVQLLRAGWAGGTIANVAGTTNPYSSGSQIAANVLGADLIVVNGLTINDASAGTTADAWETSANLLFNQIKNGGADAAWVTGLNLELAASPSPVNSIVLNRRLRRFAAENNISLLEMEQRWRPAALNAAGLYYTADYRHQSAAGATDYAGQYAAFLASL